MPSTTLEGHIVAITRGQFEVQTDQGVYFCSLRGKLRKELVRPTSKNARPATIAVRVPKVTSVAAVGDRVVVRPVDQRTGVIERVLPRDSDFTRRASGAEPLAQTILAGLDQIVAVFATAEPEPHLRMLNRLLVTAEANDLRTIICLNKCDVPGRADLADEIAVYERIGYPVFWVSARTGQGVPQLRAALAGVTSAFVGPSGVGKTSLVNALVPGANLRVGAVSAYSGKGRHTTRGTRLLPLGDGDAGQIADTPGLREFALWEIEPDTIEYGFVEFRPYLGQCRFADCTHLHEPGCAILEAVGEEIDPRRYESYVALVSG